MGLLTVSGLSRCGFFIPYRYAAQVDGLGARYPAQAALFRGREAAFAEVLDGIDVLAPALEAIGGQPPPAPRFDQGWFPPLDAAVAYALVRRHPPRRIVEVGSGHSTRFLAQALADAGVVAMVTAIDPAPRADIAGLPLTLVRSTLQEAGTAAFGSLEAGDIVFVDSSHILMPGSDVDWLLNRVLPMLAPGVMVHVHDILLPDPYPAAWTWRGYNEQTAIAALIGDARAYEVVFASHYVTTAMAARLAASVVARLPRLPSAFDTSLWLRKRPYL